MFLNFTRTHSKLYLCVLLHFPYRNAALKRSWPEECEEFSTELPAEDGLSVMPRRAPLEPVRLHITGQPPQPRRNHKTWRQLAWNMPSSVACSLVTRRPSGLGQSSAAEHCSSAVTGEPSIQKDPASFPDTQHRSSLGEDVGTRRKRSRADSTVVDCECLEGAQLVGEWSQDARSTAPPAAANWRCTLQYLAPLKLKCVPHLDSWLTCNEHLRYVISTGWFCVLALVISRV